MDEIQTLRREADLTQQELATAAGTSQSAIAAYESGRKSPTLRTVHRLARAAGLELHCSFVPPLTREDRRSLSYHAAVADKLGQQPGVLDRARRTLRLQMDQHPHAHALLSLWEAWLDLPLPQLISLLTAPDLLARDMRQVSPFAGILTSSERLRILKRFRRTEAA